MNSYSRSKYAKPDPRQNHLLGALADCDWSRWLSHLERVDFPLGKVLCESNSGAPYVYFPTTAIISLLITTTEGGTSEVAVIGNEGVLGISMIMGGSTMPSQAVVQTAGQGYRLRSALVKTEIDRAGAVLRLLLRYTQSLITQVTQTAACNRHHGIELQLARRLLMGLDRSASHELAMTQEGLASLLGVRREGVTAAAIKLQAAGVIRYQRGHIAVLDRDALEKRACECYATVRREQYRLLPTPASGRSPTPMPIAA